MKQPKQLPCTSMGGTPGIIIFSFTKLAQTK